MSDKLDLPACETTANTTTGCRTFWRIHRGVFQALGRARIAALALCCASFLFEAQTSRATLPFKITSLQVQNGTVIVRWQGGGASDQLQTAASLRGPWQNVGAPTSASSVTSAVSGPIGFYRVMKGAAADANHFQSVLDLSGGSQLLPQSIATDHANNSIVVGSFNTGSITVMANFGGGPVQGLGGQNIFIAKYSSQNTLLWCKPLGSVSSCAYAVAIDSRNNIIVTGFFYGTADFGGTLLTSHGGGDAFVAKYSPGGAGVPGSLLWVKQFGGVSNENGKCVAIDDNDDIFVGVTISSVTSFGAFTLTPNSSGYDFAVVKLSGVSGAVTWAENFATGSACDISSLAVDHTQTSLRGDVIISGIAAGSMNFGSGILTSGGGVFVARFSAGGGCRWARVIAAKTGNGVAVDSTTGNIYLTGGFQGSVNFGSGTPITTPWQQNGGIYLASYDASGNYIWAKAWGANGDTGNSVAVDGGGNIAFTGSAAGTIDFANTGIPTTIGGYIVASFTTAGDYQWSSRPGGISGAGITYDSIGNLLTAGTFEFTVNFGGTTLITTGMPDGFVARYTK